MEKKERSIRKSELLVGSWNSAVNQMTGLLLVICSMTLARRLQTHDHEISFRTWNPEIAEIAGDRRVLPSGVENEQRLQRLINKAHQDKLARCHEQLWRLACIWLVQARAANKIKYLQKFLTLTRNKMSVHIALPCVIIGSWSSFLPSQQSSSIHLHVPATEYTIYVMLCLTKHSLIKHQDMASKLWV